MTREELLAKWRARLEELARLDASVSGAKLCGEVLCDFEAVLENEDDELLDLEAASHLSGFSKDHLRRMARDGKLRAARRGRRLFFRSADLPKKPRAIDGLRLAAYDPVADARQVATRRNDGEAHG
jgi:hypothetical protein